MFGKTALASTLCLKNVAVHLWS